MVGFANMETYKMLQDSHDDLIDKVAWYFECLDFICNSEPWYDDADDELDESFKHAEKELRGMLP